MTTAPSSSDLAVAARASTLSEAEVIRSSLCSAGVDAFIPNEHSTNALMHASMGINPRGVEVLVRAEELEQAKEALADLRSEPTAGGEVETENACDQLARSAYCSAVFSLIVVIFVPLTFWYYLRACASLRNQEPTDARLFKRHMKWALVMIVITTVLALCAIVGLYFWNLPTLGRLGTGRAVSP